MSKETSTTENEMEVNPNQSLKIEKATFQALVAMKKWEGITPDALPTLFSLREVLFTRLDLIGQEFTLVDSHAQMVASNPKALATLRGRAKELQDAASETILALYPDTEPIEGPLQPVDFTRDDAAFLSWIEESGAIQMLTEEIVPSLRLLSPDQVLLLQVKTLANYSAKWRLRSDLSLDRCPKGCRTTSHQMRNLAPMASTCPWSAQQPQPSC